MSNINRSIKSTTKPYDPIAQMLALPHPPPSLRSAVETTPGGCACCAGCWRRTASRTPRPRWLDLAYPRPASTTPPSPVLVVDFQHDRGSGLGDLRAETWAWLGCRDPLDLGEVILAYARADAYAARVRSVATTAASGSNGTGMGGQGRAVVRWRATTWVNLGRARLRLRAWDWGSNRLSSSALVKHASKHDRLYVLVGQSWAWERKHGQRAWALEPRRGDLCIVRGGGTHWRHTTLLDHVANGRAYVIEGNVAPAGLADRRAVAHAGPPRRHRPPRQLPAEPGRVCPDVVKTKHPAARRGVVRVAPGRTGAGQA